ncbi:MAG: fumarate hydratase [Nitrososphaerota archaeon]|nr:fumarate hydratase [Nitrososphaerota archaeon]
MYEKMIDFIAKLYDIANRKIPEDVKNGLKFALERESNPLAKRVLSMMLKSAERAEKEGLLICQDTGIPQFFIKVGTKFAHDINLEMIVKEGIMKVTREQHYRGIAAHPITHVRSPLNIGERMPIIVYDVIYGSDYIEVTAIPKGSGSERWSAFKMFDPYDVIKDIKKFVLDTFITAGSMVCPPVVVGVGVGGTFDYATRLAKEATIRPINKRNSDPEIAKLEDELFNAINKTGIGPMGLGGDTSTLAVNIEVAYTSAVWNPVAVNFQCWPCRRATGRIYADGRIEYLS